MLLLALAAAPTLSLGDGTESRPKTASAVPRPVIASRPASMPAPTASRKAEQYHSRVRVTLKNGQKLVGIVKQNRLSERAEGFDFFPAAKTEPLAGLRLWFANPGQNYLFIPHRDIDGIVSMGLVSEFEIHELEARVEAEARAARERDGVERLAALRARANADAAEEQAKDAADAKKKKAEEAKENADALEKAKRLVDRFPPEQGWSAEKKDAILAKKANHLYPSPEELEFVKLFDAWKDAVALVEKGGSPKGDGGETGSGEKEKKKSEGKPKEDTGSESSS
ncbi:MAG TPA: hypothetical protein VKE69_03735 [Planctomycetota bacterium]|nr:hypothetical protein [Planctomycetota bacterium]